MPPATGIPLEGSAHANTPCAHANMCGSVSVSEDVTRCGMLGRGGMSAVARQARYYIEKTRGVDGTGWRWLPRGGELAMMGANHALRRVSCNATWQASRARQQGKSHDVLTNVLPLTRRQNRRKSRDAPGR